MVRMDNVRIHSHLPVSAHNNSSFVQLDVDTSDGENYLVHGSMAGGNCTVYRVQRYVSEGSKLSLTRVSSRKSASVKEAEGLAVAWMKARIAEQK